MVEMEEQIIREWLTTPQLDRPIVYEKMIQILRDLIDVVPDISFSSPILKESLIQMVETGNPERTLSMHFQLMWSKHSSRFHTYFEHIQAQYSVLLDPPFSFLDSDLWYYVHDIPPKDLLLTHG